MTERDFKEENKAILTSNNQTKAKSKNFFNYLNANTNKNIYKNTRSNNSLTKQEIIDFYVEMLRKLELIKFTVSFAEIKNLDQPKILTKICMKIIFY